MALNPLMNGITNTLEEGRKRKPMPKSATSMLEFHDDKISEITIPLVSLFAMFNLDIN